MKNLTTILIGAVLIASCNKPNCTKPNLYKIRIVSDKIDTINVAACQANNIEIDNGSLRIWNGSLEVLNITNGIVVKSFSIIGVNDSLYTTKQITPNR